MSRNSRLEDEQSKNEEKRFKSENEKLLHNLKIKFSSAVGSLLDEIELIKRPAGKQEKVIESSEDVSR